MWVSGSLIASMIVLSSSVSRPSISTPHLFAARQGEVAHDARQFAPDVADRLHAGLHHAFLQLGGDQVEPLRAGVKRASSWTLALNCRI